MTQHQVAVLVGAQFGSEGKGLIAEKLAAQFDIHIRTGAPNAGHTYYVNPQIDVTGFGRVEREYLPGERTKVVARSVPVGAANPEAVLVIGPGALVDLDLLIEEAQELDRLGLQVSGRLFVDSRAMIIDPVRHHQFEGGVYGSAHAKIGSTGEGVGPARMARVGRGTFRHPFPAWTVIEQVCTRRGFLEEHGIQVVDTAQMVNDMIDADATVMLEGTQGSGLSLIHGPWPFVTSNDTNAAQLAADAGIAPSLVTRVILVARCHPIRVAGHSGPLPNETSWEAVGRPEERTTVTKKVRRVAEFSAATVRRAAMLNRPTEMALTFADYLDSGAEGATEWMELPGFVRMAVQEIRDTVGVPVTMVGTGPDTVVFTDVNGGADTGDWPSHLEAYGSVEDYISAGV